MQEIHDLSACAAVELLRRGAVTPLQLIDVFEERHRSTEPQIHATPILCLDRARARAAALVVPDDPPPGYLFGLPILIKDSCAVKGVRFTSGSRLCE